MKENVKFFIMKHKAWFMIKEIIFCLLLSVCITMLAVIIIGLSFYFLSKEQGIHLCDMYCVYLVIFIFVLIFFLEFFMVYKKRIINKKRDLYFDLYIKIEEQKTKLEEEQDKIEAKIKKLTVLSSDLSIFIKRNNLFKESEK